MDKLEMCINDPVKRSSLERRLAEKTKLNLDTGCLEWVAKAVTSFGYGRLNAGRDGFNFKAHRVAWALAFGPIPNNLFVLHKCDNPKCVNVDHLFLGTNQDNMDDMHNKGRHFSPYKGRKGEDVTGAVINDKLAEDIWFSNLKRKEIAEVFGVTYKIVCDIKTRKSWTHITDKFINEETLSESIIA